MPRRWGGISGRSGGGPRRPGRGGSPPAWLGPPAAQAWSAGAARASGLGSGGGGATMPRSVRAAMAARAGYETRAGAGYRGF